MSEDAPSKHSAAAMVDGVSSRKLTPSQPVPVVQCTAMARSTGERCRRFALRGATVCVKHGGTLPNVAEHAAAVVEAARLRLIGLSDEAIDIVHDLAVNSTADQVRLKAATELLDRAGVRGGVEVDFGGQVDVNVETAADRARALLTKTAERLQQKDTYTAPETEDVVDAEIVEDE